MDSNKEYITKGQAKEVIRDIMRDFGHSYTLASAIDLIDEIDGFRVVPAVRCKDCKHWNKTGKYYIDGARECEHLRGCVLTTSDGYCCYGERKDGEQDEPD